MCTEITKKVDSNKVIYAWKVVVDFSDRPVKSFTNIRSLFRSYYWIPNCIHKTGRSNPIPLSNTVFHCFARREDARKCKRNNEINDEINDEMVISTAVRNKYRIIKLKLSGDVYAGLTSGMGNTDCTGMPALCATEAFWDGKFVR